MTIRMPLSFIALVLMLVASGCNRAIVHSKDRDMKPVVRTFAASVPEALRVAKKVLNERGYFLEHVDDSQGTIKTGWRSTKASSHYLDLFDHRDYGTIGAYYRIMLKAEDREGKAQVQVSAPVRSLIVGRMRSSYREEDAILDQVANHLRREDFEITNVGITE